MRRRWHERISLQADPCCGFAGTIEAYGKQKSFGIERLLEATDNLTIPRSRT